MLKFVVTALIEDDWKREIEDLQLVAKQDSNEDLETYSFSSFISPTKMEIQKASSLLKNLEGFSSRT